MVPALHDEPSMLDNPLEKVLRRAPAIPVIAFDDVDDAVPLARVLAQAGLTLVEITLRTPAGIAAIRAIRGAGVAIEVAAGTVRTPAELDAAYAAGAAIAISPGATRELIDAAQRSGVQWIPGASTPSEVMALVNAGHRVQKLFPATLGLVDALAGPFPDVVLLPTGGVDADNAREFLRRPTVAAVAGTWIAPRRLITEHAWIEIDQRARAAAALATTR
jgi:2-dehydro-3-deoxyphosphogluconate aldolase / (4S)-4-hydroxy-2-oxoglutarate aldolase